MNIKCRFGWHEWTKWDENWSGTIMARGTDFSGRPTSDWYQVGQKRVWKRECTICGRPQIKTLVTKTD